MRTDTWRALAIIPSRPGSFVTLELHATAVEVMSELSTEALKKGLEIELIGDGPIHINGNQELTGILLSNLIRNAIHATLAPGRIQVTLSENTRGACLAIEDT